MSSRAWTSSIALETAQQRGEAASVGREGGAALRPRSLTKSRSQRQGSSGSRLLSARPLCSRSDKDAEARGTKTALRSRERREGWDHRDCLRVKKSSSPTPAKAPMLKKFKLLLCRLSSVAVCGPLARPAPALERPDDDGGDTRGGRGRGTASPLCAEASRARSSPHVHAAASPPPPPAEPDKERQEKERGRRPRREGGDARE